MFIALAYRFSEASDCFTERFAQFGELAWTENHQGNYKNNDQLWHTKTSKHTTPPNEEAITLCLGVSDVNLMGFSCRRTCLAMATQRYGRGCFKLRREGADTASVRSTRDALSNTQREAGGCILESRCGSKCVQLNPSCGLHTWPTASIARGTRR